MNESPAVGLILLAAGASQRMGRPKQNLPVGDQTLLRHVATLALSGPARPVIVVLGAHAAEIAPSLEGLALHVAVNENWSEGMGGSIRTGMQSLLARAPLVAGAIIALADQPDFSAAHLQRMVEAREGNRTIVASTAKGAMRPPVFFASVWFPKLLQLQGDAGARTLLQENVSQVACVPIAEPVDLDTPEDYAAFLQRVRPAKA